MTSDNVPKIRITRIYVEAADGYPTGGSVANSGAKEAKHEPLLLPIGVQAAITRCHT
jgi:hypothetical protein